MISKARLREFWTKHPQAAGPLQAWFKIARTAQWGHMVDVRRDFPTADAVDSATVFNVGGNDFRLVVEIKYAWHKVYVRWVGTHAEYDKGGWK